MAFPTTAIIDDFNRGALGANWTIDPWVFGLTGVPAIISNQLGMTSGTNGYAAYNVATYGPSCETYITVAVKPADNEPIRLMARMGPLSSGNANGYALEFYPVVAGTDLFTIQRFDGGGITNLAQVAQELTAGDKFGIQLIGNQITGYYNNGGGWTAIVSATDSTYSAAGYLCTYQAVLTQRMDDFGGGTIPNSAPIAWTRA